MRKLVYMVHQSLDGFIEGPKGEFDWPFMGPELSAYSIGLHERVDAFVYGRRTWDLMSSFWPQAESMSNDPHDLWFAPIWRSTPKYVWSNTLTEAGWNARVMSGDLATGIAELKAQPGKDLLLTGGAELPGVLTELGLIDEYHVFVHPVVLGGGKRLFSADRSRFDLELVESRTFDGKTVLIRQDRAKA